MTKRAETTEDREDLAVEATLLRRLAHPGVVRLLRTEGGDPPSSLVLRRLPGGALQGRGGEPVESAAGWAAAVATTLADIHDLGFGHGALCAEHIVLQDDGGPVLCGFGALARTLRRGGQPGRELAAGDVAALAELLLDRLPAGADRTLVRLLRRAASPKHLERSPSARSVARALVERVPGARLEPSASSRAAGGPSRALRRPGAAPAGGLQDHDPEAAVAESRNLEPGLSAKGGWRSSGRSRLYVAGALLRRHRMVAASLAVPPLAALVAAWAVAGHGVSGRPAPAGGRPPSAGGAVRAGAEVFLTGPGGDYAVEAAPGERPVVAVGHWGCGAVSVSVLDTRSGSVWVFPAWPEAGASASGRWIAIVPGARSIAARPSGPGCDDLVVVTGSGRTVEVPAGGRR